MLDALLKNLCVLRAFAVSLVFFQVNLSCCLSYYEALKSLT